MRCCKSSQAGARWAMCPGDTRRVGKRWGKEGQDRLATWIGEEKGDWLLDTMRPETISTRAEENRVNQYLRDEHTDNPSHTRVQQCHRTQPRSRTSANPRRYEGHSRRARRGWAGNPPTVREFASQTPTQEYDQTQPNLARHSAPPSRR